MVSDSESAAEFHQRQERIIRLAVLTVFMGKGHNICFYYPSEGFSAEEAESYRHALHKIKERSQYYFEEINSSNQTLFNQLRTFPSKYPKLETFIYSFRVEHVNVHVKPKPGLTTSTTAVVADAADAAADADDVRPWRLATFIFVCPSTYFDVVTVYRRVLENFLQKKFSLLIGTTQDLYWWEFEAGHFSEEGNMFRAEVAKIVLELESKLAFLATNPMIRQVHAVGDFYSFMEHKIVETITKHPFEFLIVADLSAAPIIAYSKHGKLDAISARLATGKANVTLDMGIKTAFYLYLLKAFNDHRHYSQSSADVANSAGESPVKPPATVTEVQKNVHLPRRELYSLVLDDPMVVPFRGHYLIIRAFYHANLPYFLIAFTEKHATRITCETILDLLIDDFKHYRL